MASLWALFVMSVVIPTSSLQIASKARGPQMGEAGTLCTVSTRILDETKCHQASIALDLAWFGTSGTDQAPGGCLYDSRYNDVIFNPHLEGSPGSDFPPICNFEDPTPVPPTPAPPTPGSAPCTDNTTGTCSIYEDPHIRSFDGPQISLLSVKNSTDMTNLISVSDVHGGDVWLVKSRYVSIQARYMQDETLSEKNLFVRAVALGGEFLKGNTLIVGSLEDKITWNGASILEQQDSIFDVQGEGFFVKANRGPHSQLVEDLSQENYGITVELPSGVKVIFNCLHHHVNVAVRMARQEGGQDGLCGNFNGNAADDAFEFVSMRLEPDVLPQESLFEGVTFTSS